MRERLSSWSLVRFSGGPLDACTFWLAAHNIDTANTVERLDDTVQVDALAKGTIGIGLKNKAGLLTGIGPNQGENTV